MGLHVAQTSSQKGIRACFDAVPDILLSVIRLHSRQVDPVRRRRKISKNYAKTYADGVSVIDEILGADGNGHQPHNPNSMIKIKHLQKKSIENQWK